MFNIGFFKAQPTEYVIVYSGGKVRRRGTGLAFYYLRHNTQIVVVPTSTRDADFVFNEMTGNFQAVTVQGQFTYRIYDPDQAASLLNFTYNPRRSAYLSDDLERLPQRIANIIQMETRREILQRTLEETLRDSQAIAAAALTRIREEALLQPMGVELISLYFLTAKPTPEVAKALEAPYRETMLRLADEAIYARRAAAVEEERKIKENERNTEISLEQRRQELIALQGANALQEAEHKGRAQEILADFQARAAERTLAAYTAADPRLVLSLALKALGENAGQIGNLTITTELLAALLNTPGREAPRG
ncbi:MAG TPA: SPFH domain-containing protein [Chthonomonadaceae bacterium]|nr:SPFH domain-containing protein [Chthonomonadaceae bacterium]